MYRHLPVLALLLAAAPTARAAAQDTPRLLLPRASADSVYAVRSGADRLAESIRRGTLERRRPGEAALAEHARKLADAARGKQRNAPRGAVGALWDFRLDVGEIRSAGAGRLEADARAYLATSPGGAAPVTLVFQRNGGDWVLVEHRGLTAWLESQTRQGGGR